METKLKLTDDFFKNAKALPGAERTIFWDTKVTGFGLVVTVNGAKTYVLQYRAGRQSRRMKIRSAPNVREARKQAGILLGEVNKGHDPLGEKRKAEEAVTNTLKPIAENYLKREGKSLRSIKLRRSTFERNVFPTLGTLPINNIRRSDITKMMDRVEEECGPAAADEALAFLSRLFSWHAARSDEFRSPIVRGMRRTSQSERARQRILTDDELASV